MGSIEESFKDKHLLFTKKHFELLYTKANVLSE